MAAIKSPICYRSSQVLFRQFSFSLFREHCLCYISEITKMGVPCPHPAHCLPLKSYPEKAGVPVGKESSKRPAVQVTLIKDPLISSQNLNNTVVKNQVFICQQFWRKPDSLVTRNSITYKVGMMFLTTSLLQQIDF